MRLCTREGNGSPADIAIQGFRILKNLPSITSGGCSASKCFYATTRCLSCTPALSIIGLLAQPGRKYPRPSSQQASPFSWSRQACWLGAKSGHHHRAGSTGTRDVPKILAGEAGHRPACSSAFGNVTPTDDDTIKDLKVGAGTLSLTGTKRGLPLNGRTLFWPV